MTIIRTFLRVVSAADDWPPLAGGPPAAPASPPANPEPPRDPPPAWLTPPPPIDPAPPPPPMTVLWSGTRRMTRTRLNLSANSLDKSTGLPISNPPPWK
ncbi:MAG: hypothetical protein DCC46_11935 [Armatimonadetes bacterium]|nr:MAG: hypothetical protein DCC46_11935 [Armatimonadota bacterium]